MPRFPKIKGKLDMGLFNRMVSRGSPRHRHAAHAEIVQWAPTSDSSSEKEEEDDKEELHDAEEEKQPVDDPSSSKNPTRYSLKWGPLRRSRSYNSSSPSMSSPRRRSRRNEIPQMFASASSHLLSTPPSPISASLQTWHDPSSHRMKTLLSELESSISVSKTALTLLRASSSPHATAADTYNTARKVMTEELQTLSDLHMRLSSLVQQLDVGMRQDYFCSTASSISSSRSSAHTLQMQDATLKSYEGIITRFHYELQKKDAVIDALKETLAKSILKGEKLQRQIKVLEANLSSFV